MDTIQKMIRQHQLIYTAQVSMLAVFAAVVYFLIGNGSMGSPDYSIAVTLQLIILVLLPASLGLSYFIFKSFLSKVDKRKSLEDKLRSYFQAVLIRSALLEVPGLFCGVAAILSKDALFLAGVPVILFVFLLLRPAASAIISDLELSKSEAAKLEL